MMNLTNLDHNLTLLSHLLSEQKNLNEKNLENLISEYLSLRYENNNKSLSKLIQISDYLVLPIEDLIKDEFQSEKIIANLKKENILPDIYRDPNTHFSTYRGMRNVIGYLEKVLDQSTINWIFKKSSFQPRFFKNSDQSYLSSHIPIDIFSHLSSFGFLKEHFIQMGSETTNGYDDVYKNKIKSQKGPKEIMEVVIHEIIPFSYDRLINYELINISKNKCRIKLAPKNEVLDSFLGKPPVSEDLYYYLLGAFKGSIDLTDHKVTKTVQVSSSQRNGTQFDIYWSKAIKKQVWLHDLH
ncbi:MAG: hypothetical protein K9K67_08315 [Bacteriovoracaceae bacterium]|nr:hypothetical protein [Bacteriovoracaceae bacterium]